MGRTAREATPSARSRLVDLRADFRNTAVGNHVDEDFWFPYTSEAEWFAAVDLGGDPDGATLRGALKQELSG